MCGVWTPTPVPHEGGSHWLRPRLILRAPPGVLDPEALGLAALTAEQTPAELFQELAGVSSVSGLQMVLKLLIKTVKLGPSLGGMNS